MGRQIQKKAVLDTISFVAILSLVFLGSLWKIWEQDLYWLIRDGGEILTSWRLPSIDTWSSTGYGENWINVYWLSAIVFQLANSLGDNGLVIFRGILALVFFYLIFRTSSISGKNKNWIWYLVPIAYLAINYKIQLRPDFLIIILFAVLNLVWILNLSEERKIAISLGLIIMATNLHQGTAPMLVIHSIYCLIASNRLSWQKVAFSICFILAYFVQPYGFQVIDSIWHVLAEKRSILNPDFNSFGVESFSFQSRTWSGLSIVFLSVLVWLSYFQQWKAESRNKKIISFGAYLLFLNLLWLYTERAFPFFLVASWTMIIQIDSRLPVRIKNLVILVVWIILLPTHFIQRSDHWGFGINENVYPVKSVEFIKRTRPNQNIYHTPTYGNYLLGHLSDYRVFIDTREVPFKKIEHRMSKAFHSPVETKSLLSDYAVNVVLLPLHRIVLKPDGTYWDRLEEFFPRTEWALVFFDYISMVLVRRIPSHKQLINENEFTYLRPNMPPDFLFNKWKQNPEAFRKFEREVTRCLESVPDQWVCAESAGFIFKK